MPTQPTHAHPANRSKEMKISVVIHTYNAEKHLERVLESVKDFDEILICDMYSTDRTLEIARAYGCTLLFHEKADSAEPARNFAIQSAAHDWVLSLDADELVPAELKEFLYAQIRQPDCPAGIRIPRKNYFMGRFMHCVYPDFLLRFFKKEGTYWPPYVHTLPQVEGRVVNIPARRKDLAFIHLANDSVTDNIRKTNQYTQNEPKKRKGRKYPYLSLPAETAFRFFKFYILKGGFRDGKAGLAYAGLNAFYKYATIAKIWEAQVQASDIDPDLLIPFSKSQSHEDNHL